MNQEMLEAIKQAVPSDYSQQLHEAVWLKAVEACLNAGVSPIDATIDADKILEGFKLRFESTVGGSH